tara:strand:+ start:312 stop:482 length:171 start_codon:yes stop_codon:yes gene_type:complete
MRRFIGGMLLGVGLTLLIVLPEQKAKTEEVIEFYTTQLHECHMAYQETLRKCYEDR